MRQRTIKSPKLAKWLFDRIARSEEKRTISADMDEFFSELIEENGRLKANFWYWGQILGSIPVLIKNLIYWRIAMIKNYVKIGLRNLNKQRIYSMINITGLATGIACCMLIMLWIQHELSYDGFHEQKKNIFRVIRIDGVDPNLFSAYTPPALMSLMKNEVPEVYGATRFSFGGRQLVRYEEKTFYEGGSILADEDFFKMFSFPFLAGDPTSALTQINSIVISQELAEKYFRDAEPLGKSLLINNTNKFVVTGVMQTIPKNSHLQFDLVFPFRLMERMGVDLNSWDDISYGTYLLLHENTHVDEIREKINECLEKYAPELSKIGYLQPLGKMHFKESRIAYDWIGHADIKYVYIFSMAAFFVLLIACINFINLTTARSGSRAKEVGMRKVTGAHRIDLIKQFFGESLFMTFLALLISIVLGYLTFPILNNISDIEFSLDFSTSKEIILSIVFITFITGLLSGSYPALYLSSFKPVKVLRGIIRSGSKHSVFRKVMVVIQFSISIIFILGTTVVYKQIQFMRNRNLGYDKEQVLFMPLRGNLRNKYDTFKNELLTNANIQNVTLVNQLPLYLGSGTNSASWEGKRENQKVYMAIRSVDYDYLKTFGIEMAEGRFFSKEYPSDRDAYVLNEAAVKAMGMDSPIGKWFSFSVEGPIIGVVKNFNYRSLHSEIDPLFMKILPDWYGYMCIKISPGNVPETINFLEKKWKIFLPKYPFEYNFIDNAIERLYRSEQQIGTLFRYFTFLAVSISCLGLLGLVSFMTEQMTKEIGIRKVLGASVSKLIWLINKEFIFLIVLANIFAWPIAWFIMHKWLQGFAYQTPFGIWIFISSTILALMIAILAVSVQSIRAARANPVDSLKYE